MSKNIQVDVKGSCKQVKKRDTGTCVKVRNARIALFQAKVDIVNGNRQNKKNGR